MRGIIVYSSRTGNTEIFAKKIYEAIRDKHEVVLASEKEYKKYKKEEFDFMLFGAWIDRAKLNKGALKFVDKIRVAKLGLFGTLGAMPDSEHGLKVQESLEEILKNFESLGYSILPGLVDRKVLSLMQADGWKSKMIPQRVKDKMIEVGLNSRQPTEEEYKKGVEVFVHKLG